MKSLGQAVATSAKWAGLLEVVSRGANVVTVIILTRLLGPDDFGLLAGSLLFASLAQIVCDAGLSKALVQNSELPEAAMSVMFWTTLLLSVVMYGLLWTCSSWLGGLFGCAKCAMALRLLGLQVILFALSSVHQALLIKNLEFRDLFWLKSCAAACPGAVSIALAWWGAGAWALVVGALAGSVVNTVLLWRACSWRPKLQYDVGLALTMGRFGAWAVTESLVMWVWAWGAGFVIGAALGIAELGAYRVGIGVVTAIYGAMVGGLRPVLYSGLARLQNDTEELWRVFRRINRLVAAVVLPAGVLLGTMGDAIADVVLGQRWSEVGSVLVVAGPWFAAIHLVRFNPELYRAVGRPDINVWILGATALWVVAASAAAAPYGLLAVLLAGASGAVVEIGAQLYVARRTFGLSPWYLWEDTRTCLAATVLAGLLLGALRVLFSHEPAGWTAAAARVAVLLVVGLGAYVVSLWRVDPGFLREGARVAWQAGRSR